jgi:hypothetical protein
MVAATNDKKVVGVFVHFFRAAFADMPAFTFVFISLPHSADSSTEDRSWLQPCDAGPEWNEGEVALSVPTERV